MSIRNMEPRRRWIRFPITKNYLNNVNFSGLYIQHNSKHYLSFTSCSMLSFLSITKTLNPSFLKNLCWETCNSLGFSPGAFSSAKPIFPFGKRTRRSGTPAIPGDTHFGAIPPLFFTSTTSFLSISFSLNASPSIYLPYHSCQFQSSQKCQKFL